MRPSRPGGVRGTAGVVPRRIRSVAGSGSPTAPSPPAWPPALRRSSPRAAAAPSWPRSRWPPSTGPTSPTCWSASGCAPSATWPPCPGPAWPPASAPRAPAPPAWPAGSTSSPERPAGRPPTSGWRPSSTPRPTGSTWPPSPPRPWPTSWSPASTASAWPAPASASRPRPTRASASPGSGATTPLPSRPAARPARTRSRAPPARGGWALRTRSAMAERVRWQLEGWLTGRADRLPGALTRLALVPDEVVPDRGRQLGFWGEETEAGQRAARALARIQGLLGPEAVHTAHLRGGRDPADQVTLAPTSDRPGSGAAVPSPGPGAVPWPGQVPAPAPAIVYAEPRPAEVVDATGASVAVDGRGLLGSLPNRVRILGRGRAWSAITAWAGPWL